MSWLDLGMRRKLTKATAGGVGVIALAIGLVTLFLLTQATGSGDFYERNYERLFVLNVVIAMLLGVAICWGIWRLWLRQRKGKFGSKLLIRFALIFGMASVLPGSLIYVVSYQFVSKSIENWFDVKVESALSAGVNLGTVTLDTLAGEFAGQVRSVARALNAIPQARAGLELERIKDQLGASDVTLWSSSGQILGSTGEQRYQLTRERPSATLLRSARNSGVVTQIEGVDEMADPEAVNATVRAVALVSGSGLGLAEGDRYLEVVMPLPQTLLRNALAVQSANREYQERALSKEGLKRMYIGTLTLTFFLAVFGALVFAAVFGKQLATPLLMLADGVRQVAAGDLRPKPMLYGMDEMGGLTRSFADMTRQLADAREEVARSMVQLDDARGSLQTILDNITSGVVVLDVEGRIQSANPGALRILGVGLADGAGKALVDFPGFAALGHAVQQQFVMLSTGDATQEAADHWEDTYTLHDDEQGMHHDAQMLVVRGAVLSAESRLLVFDDITEVVSAQRMQAWGEVARRLAHEIKNPLTPIQLSAERLEYKLGKKLEGQDQALLAKSVKTIVDQVEAMKRLVNEFRDYARLPAAQLQALDLNALVLDVMYMYGFDGSSKVGVRMECEIDESCPPIKGDSMQLRQVIHNLIQNAVDACETCTSEAAPIVRVRTQWLSNAKCVRLTVLDSGPGFSEMLLKRVFEPYVTTKEKGTGLGLAVVKKIAEEHGAQIDLGNRMVNGSIAGAQVSLSFNIQETQTEAVPEPAGSV